MKKSIGLISLLGIMVLSGCGGSSNVVEYNDALVSIVKECLDANQTLYQTFQANSSTLDSIAETIQSNIEICNNAKAKASELGDFDKDSSMKDGVVNLLSMDVIYLEKFLATKPYRNISELTDEDKQAYEGKVSELNETQNTLNQQLTNLQTIQEEFAAKHGLTLE